LLIGCTSIGKICAGTLTASPQFPFIGAQRSSDLSVLHVFRLRFNECGAYRPRLHSLNRKRKDYRFPAVIIFQSSVRNGDAGRSASLYSDVTGSFAQPYLTATGFFTASDQTITSRPSIFASAGVHF